MTEMRHTAISWKVIQTREDGDVQIQFTSMDELMRGANLDTARKSGVYMIEGPTLRIRSCRYPAAPGKSGHDLYLPGKDREEDHRRIWLTPPQLAEMCKLLGEWNLKYCGSGSQAGIDRAKEQDLMDLAERMADARIAVSLEAEARELKPLTEVLK